MDGGGRGGRRNAGAQVWLGARHVAYGAKFSHVDVLAQVLMATLQTVRGRGRA